MHTCAPVRKSFGYEIAHPWAHAVLANGHPALHCRHSHRAATRSPPSTRYAVALAQRSCHPSTSLVAATHARLRNRFARFGACGFNITSAPHRPDIVSSGESSRTASYRACLWLDHRSNTRVATGGQSLEAGISGRRFEAGKHSGGRSGQLRLAIVRAAR